MTNKIWLILLVAFCGFLGALGQLFFKLSSKSLSLNPFELITNWKLFLGLFFYGVATVLFLFALKQGNLSILYPIIATSYIWVSFFSVYFLGESFPLYKWFGIVLLLISISIIVI